MNETEKQIVAWLKREAAQTSMDEERLAMEWAAHAIERGEHRQHSPAKDD
jgi:hypothetical protein